MSTELTPFDVAAFLSELRHTGCALGEPFHYFTTTTSTNDELKRLAAAGALSGTTCFADYQTQGRGRQGKHWQAQANAQVLTSVLLGGTPFSNAATLTLAVGVAVHRALLPLLQEDCALGIKWPNDLEVNGRKLVGILSESFVASGDPCVAVGIGLNVCEPPPTNVEPMYPVALRTLGCSLGREALLVHLLSAIASAVASFERSGLFPFVEYLNRYDALSGADISVDGVDGRANGIAADGALRLVTSQGEIRVVSGTVNRHSQPA